MAKKNKRYVVRKGHQSGIYNDWQSCEQAIHGYPNAEYKAFGSKDQATIAYSKPYKDYVGVNTTADYISEEQKKTIGHPIMSSICVDASCSGNPGTLEYRGVVTKNGKEIFAYGPFQDATVNIGEFLALVEGLKYSKDHNIDIIYTDSRTARARVRDHKINTSLTLNKVNKVVFDKVHTALERLKANDISKISIKKRETKIRGEIPADYGRK